MAIIFFSSPATLAGSEEKKTGPSRFRRYFSSVTLDPIIQKLEWLENSRSDGAFLLPEQDKRQWVKP
jgi:hypothetical protein